MTRRQHEIPTHLDVEDKLLFGLTARQFLYVLVGASTAYALWEQWAGVPLALRVSAVMLCALLTVALTWSRPAGRPLEAWLLAGVVYVGRPRASTWQPREPLAADWRPLGAGWQDLAPSLAWADDAGEVP